ncbi:MAG TPA: hypothetical protein PK079_10400 [Leptospiraceae bacterium]|nr:hypothetical protein [Leptospiraceae bacterium]HMW06166.1 hypothetical protein [Leptospiraceae bacterium]HMX30706.1 hypothetical protein [Leptospiraceae bacterium]HMY31827.1 hypothetical protein [Leptospiraceae bacterium]HMZ64943.1 hypothetical protein [Leptospiraceae bacterium]
MKEINEMSIGELAAFVSSHLRENGINATLSGGACVSIYSSNRYQSYDLDFIENLSSSRQKLKSILSKIGFVEESRYFKNPKTKFFIEFPLGPLTVGDEPVKEVIKIKYETGELQIISPTESIKDRLAAYYHWNDNQCLEQAFLIAEMKEINVAELERWSVNENKADVFSKIKNKFILLQKNLRKLKKKKQNSCSNV